MSGRTRNDSADYFPLDVDFFSDPKIKIVRVRYGSKGIMAYIYLLCMIYREGYYLPYNDDFICTMALELAVRENLIREIINFFAERSLLNSTLLSTDKILTSHGIQFRYTKIMNSRGQKRSIEVHKRYWLLSANETPTFIKTLPCSEMDENNADKSENNADKSENNALSNVKGNNIKGSKGESTETASNDGSHTLKKYGQFNNILLSNEEYDELKSRYVDYLSKIDYISGYIQRTGKKYKSYYETICYWATQDDSKKNAAEKKTQSSFDTDEFFEAALRNSYKKSCYTSEQIDEMMKIDGTEK